MGGYIFLNKRTNSTDFDSISKALQESNDDLRSEVAEYRKEVETLRERINELEAENLRERSTSAELKNKIVLLESAHYDLPFPQWLKNTSFEMLSVNQAYEDVFLRPAGLRATDYIGKTDFDIWPDEVARKFVENDKKAMEGKGEYWSGIEPLWVKDNDVSKLWVIYKYPRYFGKVCIGIAGVAIPVLQDTNELVHDVKFIRHLVKKGSVRKALIVMEELGVEELTSAAITLQSRLSNLNRGVSQGLVEAEDANKERAKIAKAIVDLLIDEN